MDVLERVSSILKDFCFCPTEERFSIENLYCLTLHCFNYCNFFLQLCDQCDIHFFLHVLDAFPIVAYLMASYLTNMVGMGLGGCVSLSYFHHHIK